MAMEYYLDVDCDLRRTAGGMDQLIEYNKGRNIVKLMTAIISQQDPKADVLAQRTVREVWTPEGRYQSQEVTVGQLKEQTDWIYQWTDFCGQCQYAFLHDQSREKKALVGCYSAINYPVSSVAEGLLAMTLDYTSEKAKAGTPNPLLTHIAERGITGEKAKDMRSRGNIEKKKAHTSKLGAFKKVTTDQVFEVLFFGDHSTEFLNTVINPFMDNIIRVFASVPPEVMEVIANDQSANGLVEMSLAVKTASETGHPIRMMP